MGEFLGLNKNATITNTCFNQDASWRGVRGWTSLATLTALLNCFCNFMVPWGSIRPHCLLLQHSDRTQDAPKRRILTLKYQKISGKGASRLSPPPVGRGHGDCNHTMLNLVSVSDVGRFWLVRRRDVDLNVEVIFSLRATMLINLNLNLTWNEYADGRSRAYWLSGITTLIVCFTTPRHWAIGQWTTAHSERIGLCYFQEIQWMCAVLDYLLKTFVLSKTWRINVFV